VGEQKFLICSWRLSTDEKIRQTDSVSVVHSFMRSTGSALLAAYARWGGWRVYDPRQQRQLIKGLKRLRFTPWTIESL